jgi:N-acetylneuraminic acid mutarotase
VPVPRNGCAAATDGQNVYIFGGKDTENRLKDLWMFNLSEQKYREMDANGDVPASRNGHTMEYYDGKLYVFGGIHDITWELDDLHIYSLSVPSD